MELSGAGNAAREHAGQEGAGRARRIRPGKEEQAGLGGSGKARRSRLD